MKAHWLEYKETLKETKELFCQAYRTTKKVSTIQFAQERYRIGILTKEQYINTLKREAGKGGTICTPDATQHEQWIEHLKAAGLKFDDKSPNWQQALAQIMAIKG